MRTSTMFSAAAVITATQLFAGASLASAATPYQPELVYTLQASGVTEADNDNVITDIVSFGDQIAFRTVSARLFISDGTTAGTRDFDDELAAAGITNVLLERSVRTSNSLDLDGTLLFWGLASASSSWELFTTNGVTIDQKTTTALGPGNLYSVGDKIYISNTNRDVVQQLDLATETLITVQGSYDCNPFSDNHNLWGLNGKIIFHYDDNNCDDRLVVWDPASPLVPPVPLSAQVNGLGFSGTDRDYLDSSQDWYVFEGYMYFAAYANVSDVSVGIELLRTDGTTTTLVKDIHVGNGDSDAADEGEMTFTEYDGELYFGAYNGTDARLWKTDGTEAGTVELPLNAALTDPGGFNDAPATILGGRMLTSLYSADLGSELYATDGTASGTELLVDAFEGSDNSGLCWDDCAAPVVVNDVAFFLAFDGDVNSIWVTDGTPAGTEQITDGTDFSAEYAISDYAESAPLVPLGDSVYFAVNDWADDGGSGASAFYRIGIPSLANTGADVSGWAFGGALAIAAGFGAHAIHRRRVRV